MSAIYNRPGTANLWVQYSHRGKQYRESCGSPDPAVASALLKRRLAGLSAADLGLQPFFGPSADRLTMNDLFDQLEADFRLRNIKSLKTSLCTLAKAKREFGHYRAVEITAWLVDKWYQAVRTPQTSHNIAADAVRTPTNATLNRIVSMLGQALRLAAERQQIPTAPVLRKLSERGNARQGFLAKADLEALVAALPDYLQDMTWFAALTGWQLGAIRSLTWEDVDLGERTVRLRPEHDKAGTGLVIPLEGELWEITNRREAARICQSEQNIQGLAGYFFHRNGSKIGDFRRAWATALAKAGLAPGIHFHDLRRTAVRNLIRAGVSPVVAMKISGAKTQAMLSRYNISDERDQWQAQVQAFLKSQPSKTTDSQLAEFISPGDFEILPPSYQMNVSQAVMLFRFTESKENMSFAHVFTPLIGSLEVASNALLLERLGPFVPYSRAAQKDFFNPDLTGLDSKKVKYYQSEVKKLERTLVSRSPISPMGHLKFALEVGQKGDCSHGIFEALQKVFGGSEYGELLDLLNPVYTFRNKFVAHQEKEEPIGRELARTQLKKWIEALVALHRWRSMSNKNG